MSHMIYEDYLKSALKHLKTCEYMIENLQNIDDNDMLDNQAKEEWKNHILRNIYYLCGYTIEGVVNYCIYKSVRFSNNRDIKQLNEPNLRRFNNTNVTFPINLGLFFNKHWAGYPEHIHYSIQDHKYIKNIEILKYFFPSSFNRITIINSRLNNTNRTSVLFYQWKVDMRYQTDSTHFNPNPTLNYTQGEIEAFFIFVRDEIYAKLPLLR